jgi:hypothetical protein
MSKPMTKEQVNKKYKGQYVEVTKQYDYQKQAWEYTIQCAYRSIRENTTLGEDVGTEFEFRR